jgi:hypothetical protein
MHDPAVMDDHTSVIQLKVECVLFLPQYVTLLHAQCLQALFLPGFRNSFVANDSLKAFIPE